ncbi:putative mitochondrial ribosomal protein [Operophtera brumata]|uniref:Small ribosomal subunit protein mS23 n=1 Tax=Operophtera brumata TaxID=104452 RepID=A0A0L7L870_OPEBR|nr:putative mitochondrial ribosomal protein [Operophtera brumata]
MASSRLERIGTIFTRVEGLLVRGAMKPDDRPVWFDVYRAFPPFLEPKFARPKPEPKPIRQIFYQEDVIRAKFHTKGHGTGAIDLLGQNNETQTKRLVQQYQKFQAEGVPEEELVEKSATAVGAERKEQYEAIKATRAQTPANPESVTAKVLSEADLKNIFKE